jgi:cell wall assembly regulator SMI1
MKNLLKEISVLGIKLNESAFTDEQKDLQWLGTDPASAAEIKLTEHRLGVEFPEDYKEFLFITNGFFTPVNSTEPTFERIDKVDYLKNIDNFLIELWQREELVEIGKEMARSIVIAGIIDEQYFLLIPPKLPGEKWKYWKFASWIPGEAPYEDLENYFSSVLDFLKDVD